MNLAALQVMQLSSRQPPQVALARRNIWRHNWKAIAREASARSLREWDSAPPKIARWQRKRIQHQGF